MPRIPDAALHCVVYLYPSEFDAYQGKKIGGTGFVVGVPSLANPKEHHLYIVTNKHVALGLEDEDACPFVRINMRETGTEGHNPLFPHRIKAGKQDVKTMDVLPLTVKDWTPHPAGDDLAVCPVGLSREHYSYTYISTDMFLDEGKMRSWYIGPGDDIYMVGRFINHEGQQKNSPTVRYGVISMLPGDPIKHPDDHMQESFLIEMKSQSGYSGSPVFVYGDKDRFRNEHNMSMHLLLGVDWGQLLGRPEPVLTREPDLGTGEWKYKPTNQFFTRYPTGMAKVVPAWRLLGLLNMDKFKMQREGQDQIIADARERARTELDSASDEHSNFLAGLKQVLSVSKEELDRRLQADKEQRKKKRKEAP